MLSVSKRSKFRDPPGTFCRVALRNKAPRKVPPVKGSNGDVFGGSNVRGVSAPVTFARVNMVDFSSSGVEGADEWEEVETSVSISNEADDGGTGDRVK